MATYSLSYPAIMDFTRPSVANIPAARTYLRSVFLRTLPPDAQRNYAHERWGYADPDSIIKSAVAALDTTGPLGTNGLQYDFLESVRQKSALRLPMRRVEFHTRMLSWSPAARAHWVAEGGAIPCTATGLEGHTLVPRKVGLILLSTKEAIMAWGPTVEKAVTSELTTAIGDGLDAAFFSEAPDDGEHPAGILCTDSNGGAIKLASAGTLAGDLEQAIAAFGGDLRRAALAMSPKLAARLGVTAPTAIDLGPAGGVLAGMTVVTTAALGLDSNGESIVLLDPGSITAALDNIALDLSDKALVDSDDDTPSGASLLSLYQLNLVGFKATIYANWALARPGAVVHVAGINY